VQYTTTFDRIVSLYDQASAPQACEEGLTADEQKQFREIRATLDRLWDRRRAELAFDASGPPRIVSAPDPRSQRQIARGIAPLPGGAK
jgi:hypothetical protein